MTEQLTTFTSAPARSTSSRGALSRRLLQAIPAIGFAGPLIPLAWGLNHDPSKLPSALIGRPVPKFGLRPVEGRTLGLSRDKTVPIHGITYKDPPDAAAHWLDTMGDASTRNGADRDVRVAIDCGVRGVPETFVVADDGVIDHRHIGAITDQALLETMLPLIQHLRTGNKEGVRIGKT